ncbi:hypothetical protein ACG7TL_001372 [Trametes sanguinea]
MRLTIPLIGVSPLVNALSWPRNLVPGKHTPQLTEPFAGDPPPPEEIAAILQGSESLDRYSAKPDCFRRAAASIRANCAELKSREDERVRAALSLTLCEIATAEHYSPPMECIPFQLGYDGGRSRPEVLSGSKCVDIGRVTQDISVKSNMQTILEQLWSSASAADMASDSLFGELRLVISEMKHAFEGSINGLKQELKEHTDELTQVELGMVNVMDQLSTAASFVAPVFEKLLADSIESVFSTVTLEMQHMHDLSAQGRLQLEGFRHDVEALQHDVHVLSGTVRQANNALEGGLQLSLIIQEKQSEVVHTTEDIASALNSIAQKAHAEMHSINGTAAAIKESLLKDISGDWRGLHWPWLQNALIHCFEYIAIADSGYLDLPAFRLMLTLIRVVWSLLGIASSGLMVKPPRHETPPDLRTVPDVALNERGDRERKAADRADIGRFSHDLLDLAKLPADDAIVVKNAARIREAVEARNTATKQVDEHGSSISSGISDTAKKRPRKPPKKPGVSEMVVISPQPQDRDERLLQVLPTLLMLSECEDLRLRKDPTNRNQSCRIVDKLLRVWLLLRRETARPPATPRGKEGMADGCRMSGEIIHPLANLRAQFQRYLLDLGATRAPQSRPPPEDITITVLDSSKVTFGPGFSVQQVVTGFECLQVILENVPSHVSPASITSTLEPFGRVTAIQASDSTPADSTISYKVTFATGDAAASVAAAMDGKKLFGVKIDAHLVEKKSTSLGRGTLYDGDVLFALPTPFLIGFVGYPTEELAQKAIALAATCNIGYSKVTAELYSGIPAVGVYNVRFRGLPPNFTVDDIRKHFVNPLIVVGQGVKQGGKRGRKQKGKDKVQEAVDKRTSGDKPSDEICEGIMLQRAKYQSLNGAFHGLRRMLEQFDEDVTINVVSPPYGKYVKVWGHFTTPDAAARACETLHRFCPQFVAKERIFARHIKSLRYALPSRIYDVLAPEIDLLRSYIRDDASTSITVHDKRQSHLPDAPVTVKLLSESMRSLSKAKSAFDRLLRGEKVTDNGQVVWNDFFGGQGGESFLRDLERKYPRVRISSDFRRRTLALFGVPDERERVRKEIIAKDKELRSRYTHRYSIPGDRIAGFMREGLAMLQKELGRENVWVDLTNQKLIVRGEEDAQKVAQLAVLHARQRAPRQGLRNGAACPVCFGEVSQPVALSCGHTWCKDCLAGYLNASIGNKSFPITCLADEARCAHPISLSIAQRLLSTEEFDAIVHAAFTSYVQERPKEFHYCPTPDCPQVYRKMARKTKSALQCPSCLVRICPHCNMEYHESVSCQDRDPEAEMLFEEWKMGRDVKDCPNCKVPIERSAGCNHMTCASCKTHICWACLATFTTSGEVYEHMRTIHGGIGL